jgi:hypothetical protein
MGASISASAAVACLLLAGAGCGWTVHPGLTNAPALGGTSPEMHVHDTVANGPDACAEATFSPEGGRRAYIPPCSKERWSKASDETLVGANGASGAKLSYPFNVCPNALRARVRHSLGPAGAMTTLPLTAPGMWLACTSQSGGAQSPMGANPP